MLQHFYEMLGRSHVNLYLGRAAEARAFLAERWAPLRRSLLGRVQSIRIQSTQAGARATLACAAAEKDASERSRMVRAVTSDARALLREKTPWATPQAELLLAGVASVAGDSPSAVTHLRRAADGFDAVDMALYATVARRALGAMLDGDERKALLDATDTWFRDQGVKRPDRFVAMLAPGLPVGTEVAP
jgi:hypothetical protein